MILQKRTLSVFSNNRLLVRTTVWKHRKHVYRQIVLAVRTQNGEMENFTNKKTTVEKLDVVKTTV